MSVYAFTRGALIALAGFGSLAGARLLIDHMTHGEVCPMIGPVPACVIVLLGYFSILTSAIFVRKDASKMFFYAGWMPVLLLALTGVVLELTKGNICPPGPANIPQCFYSLAMAVLCWVFFSRIYKTVIDHLK